MSGQTTQPLPRADRKTGQADHRSHAAKPVRKHRVLNVRLLVITLIFAAIGLPAGALWYRYQHGRTGSALLDRAVTLHEAAQWQEATAYFQRYLMLKPDDLEARFQLVHSYTQQAQTLKSKHHLTALLYQTLGLASEKEDLRLQLAETLLETGQFAAAQEEAEKLIDAKSSHALAAQRVMAISLFARGRPGGFITIDQANDALLAAIEASPGDVRLAALAAQTLRTHPDVARRQGIDPSARADQIIQRMVEENPDDADALLTRFRYQRQYLLAETLQPETSSDSSDSDLQRILQAHPDHVEALLLSAAEIDSRNRTQARSNAQDAPQKNSEQVEHILEHVIDVAPRDPRGYLALAKIRTRSGNHARAVSILQQGRSLVGQGSVELEIALCESLLQDGQQEKADTTIAELERTVSSLLPMLAANVRRTIENRLRLLRARQALTRGALQPAIVSLRSILTPSDSGKAELQSTEALQALELLARSMATLNRWDAAAGYWDQLSQEVPDQQGLARFAAEAYLKFGQADAAIDQLERLLATLTGQPEVIDPSIRVLLAQAHFVRQLQLSASERTWTEFEAAFQDATQYAAGRWELPLLEVNYLLATAVLQRSTRQPQGEPSTGTSAGPKTNRQLALQVLHKAEPRFGKQLDFWKGLTFAYLRLEQPEDAGRALQQYESLEPVLRNRILTRSIFLARNKQFDEADKFLTESQVDLPETERPQIDLQRIRILATAARWKPALALLEKLLGANPDSEKLLAAGVEVTLRLGDFDKAKQFETALGKLTLQDTFQLRTLRIRRLLASYAQTSRDEQSQLSQLIDSIRTERPRWYPGAALAAQHAELVGNQSEAIDGYRQAVDLGDDRPATLERLVFLLYREGLYNEAHTYLSRLVTSQPDNLRADSLAISLAIQRDRLEEALELALASAEKHPEDPMRQVWLGNLLALNQQPAEAQRILRDAVARFGADPRVWSGLFAHLARAGEADEARQVLGEMAEAVDLDEATRHFAAAQGYQALGDLADAQRHYEQTVEIAPDNTTYRLQLARHLMKTDVSAATGQFQRILKQDETNPDARRQLATLLAAKGDDASYQQAFQLLQQTADSAPGGAKPDNRLRAALLVRRGKTRQERIDNIAVARQILVAQLGQAAEQAEDIDRLLLAGIYEQEARLQENPFTLQAAREQLRYLVDRANPSAHYLRLYLDFLLRHVQASLTDGQEASPPAGASEQQKAQIREAFLHDARRRMSEFDKALRREGAEANSLALVSLQVRLLTAEDRTDAAAQAIEAFAEAHGVTLQNSGESNTDGESASTENNESTSEESKQNEKQQAQLYLNVGNLYSMLGSHELAEQWYRKLMTIAPSTYVFLVQSLARQGKTQEAAQLCIEATGDQSPASTAAVLAQIFASTDGKSESYEQAQPLIASALETHGDNLQLLLSVAVMQVSRGNNDEAIRLFRRIVELAPKHTLALNNLATLLAERPSDHAEALEVIERAMAIAGRQPALLDTLGTIYVLAGDQANAVASLEEAVAGGVTDPRYYFHLAAAYHQAGDTSAAEQTLVKARDQGLESAILTSGDQHLLDQLNQEYPSKVIPAN